MRAQARDPVGGLRRLPEPRLAADLHRELPGAHPRVMAIRMLWLRCARDAVRVGHGVSRAGPERERRRRRVAARRGRALGAGPRTSRTGGPASSAMRFLLVTTSVLVGELGSR